MVAHTQFILWLQSDVAAALLVQLGSARFGGVDEARAAGLAHEPSQAKDMDVSSVRLLCAHACKINSCVTWLHIMFLSEKD